MGRKSKIDNETLVALLEQYFMEKCDENPSLIKIPAFAEYVRNNGHPDVQDYLVRRNEAVRIRIEELKSSAEDVFVHTAVVFRNLDIDAFLARNPSPAALKNALSERDTYYKHLSASASYCMNQYKSLSEKVTALEMQNKDLSEQKGKLQVENEALKCKLREKDNKIKELKEFIDIYVYPEIANELLKKDGLIKETSGIVTPDAVDKTLIHADTEVKAKNNIIQNLFENL